ncbi:hypothetical protein OKA05_26415 [Luteolibacter arcticus]|uniref:Uncharacterized protein n=1 Tax=Luteolibacter arcticus TaxID=1581411 RepID=A0ABT3GRG1_9BACT|nr:hypothetical protein [Luteolibacter arcticus]MCW1926121.1 hypothetical protein [Luteolibacter arcticus]
MTPRRFIRWKCFWFGILVLGFLGWSSRISGRFTTALVVPPGVSIVRLERTTYLSWGGTATQAGFKHEKHLFTPAELEQHWSAGALKFVKVHDAVSIPLVALLWAAFFAWRWRRQRKLTETNG